MDCCYHYTDIISSSVKHHQIRLCAIRLCYPTLNAATKRNLEWNLNGMESALTKGKERSVYVHVGGLKVYLYLGKAETSFPIHTEGEF